jgi:hypothetical protein
VTGVSKRCLCVTEMLSIWALVGTGGAQAPLKQPPLALFNLGHSFVHTDSSFGTPPGYGCAADQAEEQRRHQDGLPYIDDSPSSSPHLSSKGRGSLASGALDPTKVVSPRGTLAKDTKLCSGPGHCFHGGGHVLKTTPCSGTCSNMTAQSENHRELLSCHESGRGRQPSAYISQRGHRLLYKLSLGMEVACVCKAENSHAKGHYLSKQDLHGSS